MKQELNEPLISQYKVYGWRFINLALFCCLAMEQGAVWNTWGPISASAESVFGWNDGDIALLANWGCMVYPIACLAVSFLLDAKGIRKPFISGCAIIVVASGLRVIYTTPDSLKFWINVGQIVNGFAGPIAMSAAPKMSAYWFAPKERTTATAVGTMFNYVGVALSFLLGPQIVNSDKMENIVRLMRIEFAFAVLTLIGFIFLFRERPAIPPSASAEEHQETETAPFLQSVKKLLKNKNFMLLLSVYGLLSGVYGAWMSVLCVNVSNLHVGLAQSDAGWLGFAGSCGGIVGGILGAVIADKRAGDGKKMIVHVMTFASAIVVSCIALQLHEIIFPSSLTLLIIFFILAGFCINGAVPLFFEMAIENTHPLPEGVVVGTMTQSNALAGIIFLSMPMDKVGTSWMNWCLVVLAVTFSIVLFFVDDKKKRLNIDMVQTETEERTSLLESQV